MCSPYPEFVLTNIICIEKALKRTEIVFVLTVFVLTRFYCISLLVMKIFIQLLSVLLFSIYFYWYLTLFVENLSSVAMLLVQFLEYS